MSCQLLGVTSVYVHVTGIFVFRVITRIVKELHFGPLTIGRVVEFELVLS